MGDGPDAGLPAVTEPNELNGPALLRWGRICLEGLQQRRAEINALNVFPIADADTGTNMLATMRAAVQAAEAALTSTRGDGHREPRESLSTHDAAAAMARGATLGARGNSGIILSQVLRGIAEAARGGPLTAQTLRDALATASVLVRASLSVPVEGTILTVLERAAESAAACPESAVAAVAVAAADGAAVALGDTPAQLGVLREAGVVDAGARGLVVLLDSLVAVTLGEIPARPEYAPGEFAFVGDRAGVDRATAAAHADSVPRADAEPHGSCAGPLNSAEPHFEVMYLLSDTDDQRIARLRDRLADLGDSVVVVGDGAGSWSAHVHCADAGAAVEAGIATGTLSAIRIESFTITARPTPAYPDATAFSGIAAGTDSAGRAEVDGHSDEASADVSGRAGAPVGGPVAPSARADAGGRRDRAQADGVNRTDVDGRAGGARVVPPARADVSGRRDLASAGVVDRPDIAAQPGGAARADATARAETLVAATGSGATAYPGSDHDGPADRAVLAVASGDGAAVLFEAGGAVVLGGDGIVTSAALLAAIRRLPNREVLVLPNGALPAHELVAVGVAARDAHRDVLLLPSGSMVQGLAALAVHDCGRIAVDDAFAMSEAAAATRWGSVHAATERALTMVGTCEAGDGLGLVGHDVVVIDRDVPTAARTLLDRMLGFGGELVTLLMGAAAPAELADELAAHIANGFPGVEVSVYSGGQQADLVQIGVE
ncbi:DAK2 domain-containing protein [Nocardia sp. NPDC052112]|uniref:DAK2 domain-containing protein n=1 Tax=Nocardia sp. NPDC052112 TaxID=3155646 RepID=UPI003428F6B2